MRKTYSNTREESTERLLEELVKQARQRSPHANKSSVIEELILQAAEKALEQ